MAEETWLDEQRLIQGLRARDPISLEALITQYSRELFYFARLILAGAGSAQDAEECLNDLFVVVWQEFDAFDPARGSLRTWLMMRARYIVLDRRRQLLRRQLADIPVVTLHEEYTLAQDQRPPGSSRLQQETQSRLITAGADAVLEQRERLEELRRALEQLPTFDRFLIYLRYFQFISIKEIAARTSLTKHAVEARLWRARNALRLALQEQASGSSVKRTPLRAGKRASLLRKEALPV